MAGMETGAALLKVGVTMMRAAPSGIALLKSWFKTNPHGTQSVDSVIAHLAKMLAR